MNNEELRSAQRGLAEAEKVREKELEANPVAGGRGPHNAGGAINKENVANMGPTLKKVLGFARPWWPHMIIALVLSIGGAVLTVISPRYLQHITDTIAEGFLTKIDMPHVKHLVIVMVAMLIGSFVFSFLQARLMAFATQKMSQRMRSEINGKIDRMPLAYFDRTSYGDTLSRVTNDVDTLSQTLNNSVATIITSLVTLCGSAFMMFYTEWRMALSGIAAALVGFVLTGFIMGVSQRYFVARQRILGGLNGHVEESLAGHMVVRAFNAQGEVKDEFSRRNRDFYEASWKADFLSGLMFPVMNFVGNLGYVVVCVVGAVLVIDDYISIGVIASFMIYIRLFTNPLANLAQAATSFQAASAASTRVFEFLEEDELADETGKAAHEGGVRGDVEFKNVKFSYTPGKEIIHGFNAHVRPGQKVAIVGPTGAGKTTLVNLLMRFYEVDSGEIRIDGVPTAQMKREDVDALFSMVLQDTWLFEGTMRENLVYRSEGVSQERLDEVVREVGLEDVIAQLPHGYETVMGEDSALSAGQRQLVTIARAMLADNPLLILDEATSSIDTRTEKLIQDAVDTLTKGRTSFVIAHRLSTIRNADMIFVMRDGDVIETGTHEELLAAGGFYSILYNSQFDPVA